MIERARDVIKEAEEQPNIPPKIEAERLMKQYNDILNEGGSGFVPHIISQEEYASAKKTLAEYDE